MYPSKFLEKGVVNKNATLKTCENISHKYGSF